MDAGHPDFDLIEARQRDLGGFVVGRVLPSPHLRSVGPFLFFDHLGPVRFSPGSGIEVRPHPHINLATVTYLFEGEILHRDSLGSEQIIRPGDVNWMTAGRGIVHSERTDPETRRTGATLHGIQSWVALPKEYEEIEPSFFHHPAATLPTMKRDGATLRLVAGEAYGHRAPVRVLSPLFYVDATLSPGAELPLPEGHTERGAYVAEGAVTCGDTEIGAGRLVVFRGTEPAVIRAVRETRVMLLGGASLDGPRHVYWNFVSSSEERILRAKAEWREGRFPKVPGDDQEFIPLPEE